MVCSLERRSRVEHTPANQSKRLTPDFTEGDAAGDGAHRHECQHQRRHECRKEQPQHGFGNCSPLCSPSRYRAGRSRAVKGEWSLHVLSCGGLSPGWRTAECSCYRAVSLVSTNYSARCRCVASEHLFGLPPLCCQVTFLPTRNISFSCFNCPWLEDRMGGAAVVAPAASAKCRVAACQRASRSRVEMGSRLRAHSCACTGEIRRLPFRLKVHSRTR